MIFCLPSSFCYLEGRSVSRISGIRVPLFSQLPPFTLKYVNLTNPLTIIKIYKSHHVQVAAHFRNYSTHVFLYYSLKFCRWLPGIFCTVCFTPQPLYAYPQILGGEMGLTSFQCLDYDTINAKILVGGLSQSNDVVGASPSPILLQYDDSTGGIVWENQIVSSSAAVVKPAKYQICKYSKDGPYALALSVDPNYAISVFDKATGVLVRSLSEYSPQSGTVTKEKTPIALEMGTNGVVYLVTNTQDRFQISAFDVMGTSPITPLYHRNYGGAFSSTAAYSAEWDSSFTNGYIGGHLNGAILLVKFDAQNGESLFQTVMTVFFGTTSAKYIAKLAGLVFGGTSYQFTCSENLGTQSQDIALIYYKEESALLLGDYFTPVKSWVVKSSVKKRCRALQHTSTTAFIIMHQESSFVQLGQIDLGGTASSLSVTNLIVGNTLMTMNSLAATFKGTSTSSLLHVGSTSQIVDKNYNKQLAYLMQYPFTSCLQTGSSTYTLETASSFLTDAFIRDPLSKVQSNDLSIQFRTFAGISTQGLNSTQLLLLPDQCTTSPAPGTITPSTITSPQDYQIGAAGLTIPFDGFSYSQVCSDAVWNYYATLLDGSQLPAFVSLTQLASGGELLVQTTDDSNQGTYDIKVVGALPDGNLENINFVLNLLPLPQVPPEDGTSNEPPTDGGNESPVDEGNESPVDEGNESLEDQTSPTPATTSNRPSQFSQAFQSTLKIVPNKFTIFTLPEYYDPNDDNVTLEIFSDPQGLPLPSFVSYNGRTIAMIPESKDIGNYSLIILLTNDNSQKLKSSYSLTIKVQELNKKKEPVFPNIPSSNVAEQNENDDNPNTNAQTQNEVNNQESFITAELESVSFTGLTKVIFSEELAIPAKYTEFNSTIIQVKLRDRADANIASWKITSIAQNIMTIQVNFDKPLEISNTYVTIIHVFQATLYSTRTTYKSYSQKTSFSGPRTSQSLSKRMQ